MDRQISKLDGTDSGDDEAVITGENQWRQEWGLTPLKVMIIC